MGTGKFPSFARIGTDRSHRTFVVELILEDTAKDFGISLSEADRFASPRGGLHSLIPPLFFLFFFLFSSFFLSCTYEFVLFKKTINVDI